MKAPHKNRASKIPCVGLSEEYLRQILQHQSGTLSREILCAHLWWWRWRTTQGPKKYDWFEKPFVESLLIAERRSAFNYELAARFVGAFAFANPYIKLPQTNKDELAKRWPRNDFTLDDPYRYVNGDELRSERPGWSRPKVLSFDLYCPNDRIFSRLGLLLDEWRDDAGMRSNEQPRGLTSWGVIEYLDRTLLLKEPADPVKEEWLSDVCKYYESEMKAAQPAPSGKKRTAKREK
jgi:hypothetical protein